MLNMHTVHNAVELTKIVLKKVCRTIGLMTLQATEHRAHQAWRRKDINFNI